MKQQILPLQSLGGRTFPKGSSLLTDPLLNKGTAFTDRERDALGLRGLLPPRVFSIEEQLVRARRALRRKTDDLEKYLYLTALQNRNETLFYRLLAENIVETMPLVYTPTVGQACLEFGNIFRRSRGLYISIKDKGRVAEILRNWPRAARLIVVTDGERILGLGDLGALGMGIPIGKLALYTACAGLHPSDTLPITLDVGTDNENVVNDPLYIGLRQRRVRGAEYDALIKEFVAGVKEVFPGCLIQWEDFGNTNAFRILEEYRHNTLSFNDDIQGTAAVSLAGLIAGVRLTGVPIVRQKILFLGAGEAGTGIGELFVSAAKHEGVLEADARKQCWYVDSKGLVVKSRTDLVSHKLPFAHEFKAIKDFEAAVHAIKPTAIIGVSGMARMFTQPVVEAMTRYNERPIIMALSNPTSKAECTAQEAYDWSEGRCLFASGSPFPDVTYGGKTSQTGQGNNVYIFPGVGLGAVAVQATEVTDSMFLEAAKTLAREVTDADLAVGRVFPSLSRIREVSEKIAVNVAELAYREGLATLPRPANLADYIQSVIWYPRYVEYV